MRKRKWVRVVLWSIGGLAFVVGGLLIALWVTSPSVPELTPQEDARELPADWLDPQPEIVPAEAVSGAEDSEPVQAAFRPFASQGTLVLIGDDGPFGEETYEISITEEGSELTSSGRFWFKVVVARIVVSFEQSLIADGALRPKATTCRSTGRLDSTERCRPRSQTTGPSSREVTKRARRRLPRTEPS